MGMIQINMPMPEKCDGCIFCNDNCSCVASDYDGFGINVGCAYRTGRRDIRCPLKEQEAKQVIKKTYHVMMNRDYENPVEVTRYDWLCPTCKSLLCRDIDVIDDNYHFCKVCGQAVKWE